MNDCLLYDYFTKEGFLMKKTGKINFISDFTKKYFLLQYWQFYYWE